MKNKFGGSWTEQKINILKLMRSNFQKFSKISLMGLIEILRGLKIDLWVLNPTNGTNRLLVRKKEIAESWLNRLKLFLGMKEQEILDHFYSKRTNLFGDIDMVKGNDSINKLHELYAKRIAGNIFKYVSNPKLPLIRVVVETQCGVVKPTITTFSVWFSFKCFSRQFISIGGRNSPSGK